MTNFRQIIPPGFNHTSKVYKISNQYFLMIPKNASNTILFGTKLKAEQIDLTELDSNTVINIFIRDPVTRFKASLLESIKRCSLFNKEDKIANFSSVPVSKDIEHLYKDVFKKISDEPFKFVLNILEIISSNFYDPHLCPQWFFFTDLNRNPLTRIRVHNLEMINEVMEDLKIPIKKSYNIQNSFDLELFNSSNNYKEYIKKFLSKLDNKFMKYYHSLKLIRHSSVQQSDVIFNFINYEKWLLISKKIKDTIDNNQELKDLILQVYQKDKELYINSKKNKKLFLSRDFRF